MPGELNTGRTQHEGIIENTSVDFTNAAIRIKENNEENKREAQRNLGPFIDAEQQNENRREDQPGQRVQDLNVWIENSGLECGPSQKEADGRAQQHPQIKST
jgi:hypothetical protein